MMLKTFKIGLIASLLTLASTTVSVPEVGPVTKLPIPRFVSMKADEGNVRRGPSLSHRIDWVFKRQNMPLKVVGEYGHWRRVQDIDGQGGWMHFRLLSGVRTVIVQGQKTPMRRKPLESSEVSAFAEQGVVARLGKCDTKWCRISVQGHKGWVMKDEIWGVGAGEIRE